jgi:hypothetical protein
MEGNVRSGGASVGGPEKRINKKISGCNLLTRKIKDTFQKNTKKRPCFFVGLGIA